MPAWWVHVHVDHRPKLSSGLHMETLCADLAACWFACGYLLRRSAVWGAFAKCARMN